MNNVNINPDSLLKIPGNVWIYWKDIKGTYLGCNDIMAKDLCLSSRQDIRGRNDHDFPISKHEIEYYYACDQQVVSRKIPLQFYDTATILDSKIDFLVLKSPIVNDSKVVGVLGFSYYINKSDNFSNEINIQLSPREQQCLDLFLRGYTSKETAKKLNLSYRTVEEYCTNIKKKLGCRHKRDFLKFSNNFFRI